MTRKETELIINAKNWFCRKIKKLANAFLTNDKKEDEQGHKRKLSLLEMREGSFCYIVQTLLKAQYAYTLVNNFMLLNSYG